ncbi:MAG: hypothetical protein ACXWL8_05930, partial [Candidatus Limnocylindria bacterium]
MAEPDDRDPHRSTLASASPAMTAPVLADSTMARAHRIRFVLGGAVVDLLAISGAILVRVKNLQEKVHGI